MSPYDDLDDCIASGQHLQDCDDDGYCNNCGHQDSPDHDDGPVVTGTVTLPILALGEEANSVAIFASKDDRFRLVRRAVEHLDLPEPPEGSVWGSEPLKLWCWFVLKANDLEVDPDVHYPLVHWGIDLGFSDEETRRWAWAVA